MKYFYLKRLFVFTLNITYGFAQQVELIDQYENTTESQSQPTTLYTQTTEISTTVLKENITPRYTATVLETKVTRSRFTTTPKFASKSAEVSLFSKILKMILQPLYYFVTTPKVNTVLRNVATCAVNGFVEIVSYYFPAPLIPIVASIAGMLIPFEPVLMLRDKLPVTSYRRAFLTAMNTFLGTFEKYKLDDNYEYDPYMTQRFHRRMMSYPAEEKKEADRLVRNKY